MDLAAIRSFFCNVPVLALTATAPPKTISLIQESLAMVSCKVIKVYPDRRNIYLTKHYRLDSCYSLESFNRILKPIAYELLEKKQNYPMTVVYTKLQYCGYAYRLFEEIVGDNQYVGGNVHPSCSLFAQYHAPQTGCMKTEILKEIKKYDSNIRVIFATSALGMGVDAPGITKVIHIGPPSTLENYLQEIGRAGRRGCQSTADLYFCNSDVSSLKIRTGLVDPSVAEYCLNETECQRKQLMVYFGFNNIPVQDKCCCICDGSFGNETSCIGKKPAFPKGKVRTVTPENLSKLSSELFGFISTTNAINALEDEDCLFGQTPHVSENTVKDILTHAELISTEDDLLTELGIWDQTHSSAIFSLILKYSSVN